MGLSLMLIVLGAIVKDDVPALAQQPEVAQNAPGDTPNAQDTPQAAPAPTADNAPQDAAPTANNVPQDAAPTADNAPQDAAPTAANAPQDAAPAAANAPQAAAPAADAPAPQKTSKTSLIEQKKAEDTTGFGYRILSIVGLFAFIGIAYLLSNNRKKVLWKLVAVGTGMQFLFAVFILWTPVGKAIFAWLNDAFTVLLGFTSAGTTFLFASYASGAIDSPLVNTAMSILPPIIFFSSLMTVLYYLGVMQWIVKYMAVFMMKFMGTSGSESLSSVANIFVGMTEAPLVVKPYVGKMTQSELFAIMTGGMATVAGGTMAAYVAMLSPYFPDIAGHLIAASVMSAPASLVIAKLMIPETEESETRGKVSIDLPKTDANVIDAAARGAGEGLHLALNVAAMLLAFIAIIALINFVLGLPSRLVNANTYDHVSSYVVSEGGELDPNCDSIRSTSDTLACTHGALIQLADIKHIQIGDDMRKLKGDQSEKIDQIDKLYDTVMAAPEITASVSAAKAGESLEKKSIWPLLTLETIFGWLFFPFAFLMGVPFHDCFLVGQLLGEKMAVNEFVAYLHLADVVDKLSYRAIVISTYALCGFANFGSIAIQIGGIGGMAPHRRSDIAKFGIKAMIAGTLAAFMTATLAGLLI